MTERFMPKGIYTTPEAPIVRKAPITELTPSVTWGYAGGGDIFMPEPGRGEGASSQKSTAEPTLLTKDNIVVLNEFRAKNKETLPIEVRGAIDNLLSEAIVNGAGSEAGSKS